MAINSKFALTPGYTLIGAQEYDEILYLVSVNEDDMLEVGSYPSLKKQVPIGSYNGYILHVITDQSGFEGFENEYKPLPSIWRSEELDYCHKFMDLGLRVLNLQEIILLCL